MTPQELRLGNLIQFENKTLEVATIGTEFCVLSDGTNTYDAWYDEIQPIPLTKEWLLKCVFEKVDSGHEESHEDYHEWYEKVYPEIGCIYQGDGDYVFWERHDDLKIYHLHHFQNLHHALTGKELEI